MVGCIAHIVISRECTSLNIVKPTTKIPHCKLSANKFRIFSIRYNKRVLTKLHKRPTQFDYYFCWNHIRHIYSDVSIFYITILHTLTYVKSFNSLRSVLAWRTSTYLHSLTSLGRETATGVDIHPYIRWVHIRLTWSVSRLLIIWPNQEKGLHMIIKNVYLNIPILFECNQCNNSRPAAINHSGIIMGRCIYAYHTGVNNKINFINDAHIWDII